MFLKVMKDDSFIRLRNNISINSSKYLSGGEWISNFFNSDDYFIETSVEVCDFELDKSVYNNDEEMNSQDLKNSIILHEAFKELPPSYARNGKLWTYLCHTTFSDYINSRFLRKYKTADFSKIEQQLITTIATRFFLGSGGEKMINDNALSRLYWYAHLTYDHDPKCSDPYHLLRVLFTNQTFCSDIMGTRNRENPQRVKGILMAFKEFMSWNNKVNLITAERECIKYLNRKAAVVMFEILDTDEIYKLTIDFLKYFCDRQNGKI